MKRYGRNILIASLAISGLISITGGAVTNKINLKKDKTFNVKVVEKSIAKEKSNKPVLKEITSEVNMPLSVNVKDYIDNLDEIDEKVLNKFELDTSLVNVQVAGSYTYTVTYKDKKYNGTIIIKEKELPAVDNLLLKELTVQINAILSTNVVDYITDTTNITEEVKTNMKLDINNVNTKTAGTYQYTITYNNKVFTGSITVYEPQPEVTPAENTTEENTESNP